MGKLEVDVWVPGAVDEVQSRWLDTDHWPNWMDEVEEVLSVSPDWPDVGATVHWRSPPSGRGEVTETVVEYAEDDLITTDLVDATVTARQTVTFTAADDGVAVGLTLAYRISKRGPLTPLLDRFFVRPAVRSSLTSTIERFSGELTAHREPKPKLGEMFVFKAAVVGDGASAEEIARAIEAAGVSVTHLVAVPEPSPIGDVEFVIATGLDDLEAAQELFAELDAATPSHAVLAADTASMPITDIAELTDRADKVIGFHFAGPATKIRAVEVIEGEYTSPETVRVAAQFAAAIRKTAVRCVESPGSVISRVKTAAEEVPADVATLRRLVECCRLLEEGVATMKEIDGALAAAGVKPPPFAAADESGLDDALAQLEVLAAEEDEHGELFEPPVTLRRLVAQGRLGRSSGQGFYAYGRPDLGWEDSPVKLESRGEVAIAWLDRPPANSISPEVIEALSRLWTAVTVSDARALVIASANPNLFCAGADIKAFTRMDRDGAAALVGDMHALLREFERSSVITIAAVGGLALGGGCELAMACDLRVAADSASFGQPEVDLGLIPGFGGTQRLPRLIGIAKALEMNISGIPIAADEAYELGLANRLVPDHELLDIALNLARGLARQAPRAVQLIKQVSAAGAGDLDGGIEAEKGAFVEAFVSEDGREGVAAFIEKRPANFKGSSPRPASR